MTSRRSDIRKAAVSILGHNGVAPYPTIAQDRVYDSRSTVLTNYDGDDKIPAILVYTDDHEYISLENGSGWPFQNIVEIVIELTIAGDVPAEDTDGALEELLDTMEEQVIDQLFNVRESEDAIKFSKLFSKITEIKSLRVGNANNNNRLAMRGLVVTVQYSSRCKRLEEVFGDERAASIRAFVSHSDQTIEATLN